ncbi:RING-type E3 ubiquitin-protein ligase PPIL2 [Halotydeus destructor]|nr:RING-type E3 ubiquitin-protein ligase PPIL2 [Halotydeus destructor]
MGKRQHQKDKMYLTCTEWTYVYGGRRPDQDLEDEVRQKFRRLPYDHCALSLQPFHHPYCNQLGYQFDIVHIVPFLKKFGKDPVSGEALDAKQLVKLNYTRNNEGFYHCPVMFKTFNENSHIVAIKTTGNVFSYEAVEELNIKTKNFRDLINDETFSKKDIITIQDPMNADKMNAADFYHFKNRLQWLDEEDTSNPNFRIKKMDMITKATLEELSKSETNFLPSTSKSERTFEEKASDTVNAAPYSTGRAAASLTSTVMEPHTKVEAALLSDDTIKYQKVNKKGYLQLQTSLGTLNFELYCDQAPKACDNFIRHCRNGYYDNTVFHRLIKNFMVQGGDPAGTGKGGESVFGAPFEDEFRQHLSHTGRGILSMANSGPNTNKSQFFITFRSCKHLDKKHTVFGRLVGGLDTLEKIEKSKVDEKDRPLEPITVLKSIIYVDPFAEIIDNLAAERNKLQEERAQAAAKAAKPKPAAKEFRSGVGAFIDLSSLNKDETGSQANVQSNDLVSGANAKKSKNSASVNFGDFSSWA